VSGNVRAVAAGCYDRAPVYPVYRDLARERAAEERERAEWTEGIRRRLGLVAEVHRCWVWRGSDRWWKWWCQREGCYGGEGPLYGSQPDALGDALAHARSFVPQPPEPEPFTELDELAFEAIGARILPAGKWMPWLYLTG
jgi:hypothetical protein